MRTPAPRKCGKAPSFVMTCHRMQAMTNSRFPKVFSLRTVNLRVGRFGRRFADFHIPKL
jgi:hypothetical protein